MIYLDQIGHLNVSSLSIGFFKISERMGSDLEWTDLTKADHNAGWDSLITAIFFQRIILNFENGLPTSH